MSLLTDYSDEFDTLDLNKWKTDVASWSDSWSWDPDRVTVAGGKLKIQTTYDPHMRGEVEVPYKSGILESRAEPRLYGYFEARMKGASRHPGVCPAFWLYNDDRPTQWTEIDITELTQSLGSAKTNWYSTHVFWLPGELAVNQRTINHQDNLPFDPRDDFHVYAVDWNPVRIIWYVDGVEVARDVNTSHDQPLNVALSMGIRAPLLVSPSGTGFPTEFEVDYVRAYDSNPHSVETKMYYPGVRHTLGFTPPATLTANTQQMNSANSRVAFGLIGNGKTLNSIRLYFSAVTGTVVANDIQVAILGDDSGAPNAANVIDAFRPCSTAISAAGMYDWTGFTTPLTIGSRFWIVVKNVNATPASNNVSISNLPQYGNLQVQVNYGPIKRVSTDGGSTWGTATGNTSSFRLGYSNGSYGGLPIITSSQGGIPFSVYSTRMVGSKFTIPDGMYPIIRGLAVSLGANIGTPSANPNLKLYVGSTPRQVGNTILCPSAMGGSCVVHGVFDSPVRLPPRTICRVVMGEQSNADTTDNRYRPHVLTPDPSSISRSLMPFGGIVSTVFDGSNWTDDESIFVPVSLHLDDETGPVAHVPRTSKFGLGMT